MKVTGVWGSHAALLAAQTFQGWAMSHGNLMLQSGQLVSVACVTGSTAYVEWCHLLSLFSRSNGCVEFAEYESELDQPQQRLLSRSSFDNVY